MKRLVALCLTGVMILGLCACGNDSAGKTFDAVVDDEENEQLIVLGDDGILVNGNTAGTERSAVYVSNDIIYYEDKDVYESGNPYGEGEAEDKHSADEAAAHTVVNITEAGTYRLQGQLSQGQIRVDLGEDAFDDPDAVVTLILDSIKLNCDVAPAILFMNVYECDNNWNPETAQAEVDTSDAGANIVIADDSVNSVEGAYVARIFKDNDEEKKLWKQDGAVYSYMSMNVDGESEGSGALDITADNEGLDTELHLTVNGGNINIRAMNDGINTNEDGVSVTTINGGNLHIIAGLGEEGDGVDSNGWLVINGGTVISSASPMADAGLDSDMGSYINGGTVVALGSTMDWAESDSDQVTMNLQFADYKDSADAIVIKNKEDGSVVFAYDPSEDEVVGENIRKYMGAVVSCGAFALEDTYQVYIGGTVTGTEVNGVYDIASVTDYVDGVQQGYTGTDVRSFFGGGRPQMPEGMEFPEGEMPQMPEGKEFPEGEMSQMPEGKEFPEGEMPQMPEGKEFPEGKMPQMPEGMKRPQGEMPQMPGGMNFQGMGEGRIEETGEVQYDFYMQDKVNNFSGVADSIQE